MTENSDAQAIIDITRAATKFQVVEGHDDLIIVTNADGTQQVKDLAQFAEFPRRTVRTVEVWDAQSFLSYVNRHAITSDLEVWADEERRSITAILNAPAGEGLTPGWCDHRATLTLRLTSEWKAWADSNGQLLSQTVFAEHVEDNLPDIVNPAGADMLELAQTFQATTKVAFQSHKFLDNGMRALEYNETGEAKAGRRGQVAIPATFQLGLRPFQGSDPYRVLARLRWRITDGELRIGYKLDRPDEVLRSAFGDVAAVIGAGVDVRVNDGRP